MTGLERVEEILKWYHRKFAAKEQQPCCTPPDQCRDCAKEEGCLAIEKTGGGHKGRR